MDDLRAALTKSAGEDMAGEARAIVDEARARGLALRMLGGLAVREHCAVLEFCERDYLDLDLVGRRREIAEIRRLFLDRGYQESVHVMQATRGRQLQFSRPCRHCAGQVCLHEDDHVDVFLDRFKMDHEFELGGGLQGEAYTLTPTDTLLTKLQIFEPGAKDLRDMLTLLKDVEVDEDGTAGGISAKTIAGRCASDWGLQHDVERNLDRCAGALDEFGLDEDDKSRVEARLRLLRDALDAAPKSLAWRLRAKVGERRPWHNVVEEQGEDDL